MDIKNSFKRFPAKKKGNLMEPQAKIFAISMAYITNALFPNDQ